MNVKLDKPKPAQLLVFGQIMKISSCQARHILTLCTIAFSLSGCSISEEMKRIDQVNQKRQRQESARTENLSGEQIFLRSCNTCHPHGKMGTGPALDQLDKHFPNDAQLASFIRHGSGMMPGQPKETLNDQELSNLIAYLRAMNQSH